MKTKILSGATYDALKAKADNYDSVVSALVAKNEGTTAEDITLETIQEVINAEETVCDPIAAERVTELEATVETLTTERDTLTTAVDALTTERDTLKTQNLDLSKLPGAESVVAIPEAEASAATSDEVLEFAAKNPGNILEIAAKMREAGYK